MAYVSVPKDLTKVKNKVAFNLTKRQLICIGIGAAMGIPCYFLFRNALGINNAAVLMVLMMLPAFLFAMYEKDGMHLEDVLMHVIRVKFIRPSVRKYETENYYELDPDGEDQKTMRKEERKGGKSGVYGCIISLSVFNRNSILLFPPTSRFSKYKKRGNLHIKRFPLFFL